MLSKPSRGSSALIGHDFINDVCGREGTIVARPEPGWYLVEVLNDITDLMQRELVPIEEMAGWILFAPEKPDPAEPAASKVQQRCDRVLQVLREEFDKEGATGNQVLVALQAPGPKKGGYPRASFYRYWGRLINEGRIVKANATDNRYVVAAKESAQ